MNKVFLIGRLSAKPYKNVTPSNVEYSRFTMAIRREYAAPNSEPVVDFVPCVAWRSNATFINKYLDKGSLLLVEGTFQSSRFNNGDGQISTSYVVSAEKIQSLETREMSENRRKNNNGKEFNIATEESNTIDNNLENNHQSNESNDNPFDQLDWDL